MNDNKNWRNLDDIMQQGYSYAMKNDSVSACNVWKDVWSTIISIMESGHYHTISDLDEDFNGTEFISNWVTDYEIELSNAGIKDSSFFKTRIDFCEEYLKCVVDRNELNSLNMRRAIAESYFRMGQGEAGEREFKKLTAEHPTWGWGWIGWSDEYGLFSRIENKDNDKAIEILTQALEIGGINEKVEIKSRLKEIYESCDMFEEANLITIEERNTKSITNKMLTVPEHKKKIGRNEPCPCGSGKKFKKCCLHKQQSTEVENDNEYTDFDKAEFLMGIINNLHKFVLKKKPHIKEYEKIRKLHGEIINKMIDHFESGKFKQKVDADYVSGMIAEHKREGNRRDNTVILLESKFDLETREGTQGFYEMLIYKKAPNINCITEEFIQNHRYRKPEKIEFLQSMLDSEIGLFEITGLDSEEGYAYLKEVFTGSEYKITDIGLSGNRVYDSFYLYTRIITYQNVSFGTGLSLMFSKTDPFIKSFIERQKKDYKPLGEFARFVELHNRYSKDSGGIKAVINDY